MSRSRGELRIEANAVSRGIGIGRVVFPVDGRLSSDAGLRLDTSQIVDEIARFRSAVDRSAADLQKLAEADATGIFGVQQLILEDSLVGDVERAIRDQQVSAETALRSVSQHLVTKQRSVDDRYISEKYIDIQDVTDRLLRALAPDAASNRPTPGVIFVMEDLSPSRFVELARLHPKAFITSQAGWTSHTSILGRELRIPIVTGFHRSREHLSDGDTVIVNALEGEIIIDPTAETIRTFRERRNALNRETSYEALGTIAHTTADGRPITIRVNANTREGYERAKRAGASGIGLFRSEALLADRRDLPGEEEQFEEYTAIGRIVGDEGIRIRTFDIGTDSLPGFERPAHNPALGLRAIRLGLTHASIFATQIRAILRASAQVRLDIVLPMVSGTEDIRRARELISTEANALLSAGIPVGEPKIGVMVEVPSAVLEVSSLAKHADFLCLGTNDLVQYLLAADRDDPGVADWYQTLHPAVVRSIRTVLSVGSQTGKPVAVCGEMAGAPFYVPLLIGLGATELSVSPSSVEGVRRLVTRLDSALCVDAARLVDGCETADEIGGQLREFYREHWDNLFPMD